jgi:hypothetical protein
VLGALLSISLATSVKKGVCPSIYNHFHLLKSIEFRSFSLSPKLPAFITTFVPLLLSNLWLPHWCLLCRFIIRWKIYVTWLVPFITGWALSPIFFGKMLDVTCYIWQSPCSSSGACELYDLRLFRLSFHGLSIAIRSLALLCLCCLMIMTRNWEDWKFSTRTPVSTIKTGVNYTHVQSDNIHESRYGHSDFSLVISMTL